jgi:hypothetical protein
MENDNTSTSTRIRSDLEDNCLEPNLNKNRSDSPLPVVLASKSVLRSWSRKELHHLVGAGAVTRCGSGSDTVLNMVRN